MQNSGETQLIYEDLFIAHIAGMDAFARALIVADDILENSDYRKLRKERYNSFASGAGKDFEDGKLKLGRPPQYGY